MSNRFKKFTRFPWYPLLVGIFPALALYANNVNEARLVDVIRPMLICLLIAGLIFMVLRLLLGNKHRAAFATSMWLILFFSYGHLINYLKKNEVPLTNRMVLAGWLLLAAVFLWLASRKKARFSRASASLNLLALALLVYPLYQVISIAGEHWQIQSQSARAASSQPVDPDLKRSLPDIYFIILDSYARQDLLEQAYQYDNSPFIDELRQMGFFVADCSMSNYMRTDIALASTLNLDYLPNLSDKFKADTYNRTALFELLKHSLVRTSLEQAGYQTVAFATGFPWSELDDADQFMAPSPLWSDLTEFEEMLLNSTLARVLEDSGRIDAFQISSRHYRERTGFVLDSTTDLLEMEGPKFVFMHIISPHPPFVFGPDGEPTDPKSFHNEDDKIPASKYALGYTNQLTYLNKRMGQMLKQIIQESTVPPIILLQGDHGPWMQPENKRFWILNAYYLPDESPLYATITPVNSFRLALNQALGTRYSLLPDESYFSPIPYIYDFKANKNTCKP